MALPRTLVLACVWRLAAANVKDTATPPMGWNSYNSYNCNPNEAIMHDNAQGLVDLGLADLGYTWVTTDCGWGTSERDSQGRLQWNEALFPSGGRALGEFMHERGLKFGVYSGGGYYQCGSEDLLASLGHESVDAETFAAWGADSLKYDNCYSTSPNTMVDYDSPEAGSPDRFRTMSDALEQTDRDIMYQVCQWGCGTDLGIWAPPIGNSWRISNDIQNNWKSIWRIANEVVPYAEYTGPGAFPDMDMLIVGLDVLNEQEERFHFTMWAINKSPLIIGCPTDPSRTPQSSLDLLANEEVIAINQDALAKQAKLVRRDSVHQWDLWAGPLSGDRMVVAVANWNGGGQSATVDLARALGVESADARDVWAAEDLGNVSGEFESTLGGHELRLLVLSNIVRSSKSLHSTGYHQASSGRLSGSAQVAKCSSSQCNPAHSKVGYLGSASSVTLDAVQASSAGSKLVGVDYINYEVALGSAWGDGDNTRNLKVEVNGQDAGWWGFPISGGDWYDTGRLVIDVEGFKNGDNTIQLSGKDGDGYGPDIVGLEVLEFY